MFKPALAAIAPYRVPTPPHRIKLNQNEHPRELPAAVRRRILARMGDADWSRYPPFPADGIRRRLARRFRLPVESILVGHGSNEVVLSAALATLRKGSRVVVPSPSFPVFERVAAICEATIARVPFSRELAYPVDLLEREASRPSTRLVFLASPNNPTGSVLRPEDAARIARSTRALVVVDEAYAEFAARTHRPLLDRAKNVVVTRTFSKAFALAGLRLGWAMGRPEVIARLEAATLPFSIDRFAQIAAEEMLDRPGDVRAAAQEVRRERERVRRALAALDGVRPYPSEANFLLVRFPDGRRMWNALLARGILVRDVSAHPALANCLRITIGRPRENEALLAAVREVLA
jgi:histidinol-phosphate aminotransferase